MLADQSPLCVDKGETLRHCVRGQTLMIIMMMLIALMMILDKKTITISMVLMIKMLMVMMVEIMVKVMMMVVGVMVTVLSLQDSAGLVDDSPKLTNLHGMLLLTL